MSRRSRIAGVAPVALLPAAASVVHHAGGFLRSAGRALAGQRSLPRYALSLSGLWALCALALIAIYITQELLEGLLATGHPAGLAGIFAYGGWWSIPAATCVGLVFATLLHGARWVLDDFARRHARRFVPPPARPATIPRLRYVLLPVLPPLAGGWSGRGPPA